MKVASKLLLSTLVLAGVAGTISTTASAAETQTYGNHGIVNFVHNDGTTDPGIIDPENPGTVDPTDPTDPTDPKPEPGTGGPLSIDFVSNYTFGEQKVSGNNEVYNAALINVDTVATATTPSENKDVANFLQVSDNRGTVTGWKLGVKQTKAFTNTADAADTLDGTVITLTNPNVRNKDDDTTKPAPSTLTKSVAIDGDTTGNILVMEAADGEGAGTWSEAFGNVTTLGEDVTKASVTLAVPGAAKKTENAKYISDMTWTLTDASL